MKIMVVDDELPAIEQLVDLLQETGKPLTIESFQNPREALGRISSFEPDLLYLDIEMPGLTGISFAEQLMERNIACKVVFVTAYEQYALSAFQVMAMDYLLKPVDQARLVRTLERVESNLPNARSHATPVKVSCFGSFKVESEQGPVMFNTAKAEELLAYLILRKEVSIDQIMEDIFTDFDSERARWYIHTCLYQIRSSLRRVGLDARIRVAYTKRKYSVTLEDVDVDVYRFVQEVAPADKVAWYRGELLADCDAFWKMSDARAFEETYKEAIRSLLQEAEKSGHSEAVKKYSRILQTIE